MLMHETCNRCGRVVTEPCQSESEASDCNFLKLGKLQPLFPVKLKQDTQGEKK
jgi:hypothetical protein